MKHETFKHTLQDQKPGEPECLLILTNGVEIRDSREEARPGHSCSPHRSHRCGSLQPHQDRQEMDKEAPGGRSPAGAKGKWLPGVERHCPLQAQLQLRTQTPNTGLSGHTLLSRNGKVISDLTGPWSSFTWH